MQTYLQSTSNLNLEFYILLLPKLILLLSASSDYIVKVMKSLYDIPEVGNHWFATYYTHYKENLGIEESIYNSCFLYKSNLFGIMGM